MLINKLKILLFFILLSTSALATHNRAGEITYVQVSDLTYEVTITTYTYLLSNVEREDLEVEWGDGTFNTVPRVERVELPDYYLRNRYVAQHTFPGPGIFQILVQDPNRNYGVENIPNSVNTVFSVKTTLFVDPSMGYNSTPILLNPPINQAAQYKIFTHNPGAYDLEGDSLSYSLTNCTGEDGESISGYSLPPATTSIGIDAVSGDFVWNTPPSVGKYNVAIKIDEWRHGVKIGSITRDMQIDVFETENIPPVIDSIPDICVMAGDTVSVLIRSTDDDTNDITLTASGGPFLFQSSPASIEVVSNTPGENITKLTWITNCSHIREESFSVILTARDNHPDVKLVGINRFNIKVIGPKPNNLLADPGNAFIRLNWESPDCNPEKYLIYRRVGALAYSHDSCTTGLDESSGYEFIGETSDTLYIDNDNGEGLVQGFDYCYRIVAEFPNSGQSFPSDEICASLAPGYPVMTNVSVLNTNETNGEMDVRWLEPKHLDTIPGAVGPFKYIIFRSDDAIGMRLEKIDSVSGLSDTTYFDSDIDTKNSQYSYKIDLYNDTPGNRFRIGIPPLASSIFLLTESYDNTVKITINKNTPWLDNEYVIYRYNNVSMLFDSIDFTTSREYIDDGLKNGSSYCYKVKSIGTYTSEGVEYPTINWSNEVCDIPEDFQRPCPPKLEVRSVCDSLLNKLSWNNPNLSCADDVISYNIFFKSTTDQDLELIHQIDGAENTHFEHESLGGCYAVSAVDSFDNESDLSYIQCVDICTFYELPNVFSPNGDGINDVYEANNPLDFVKKVDMRIFNRWGELVFQTDNPLIKWDGKTQDSNNLVSNGVYYYLCDVWEPRITGLEVRNIVGFIHVYTQETDGNVNYE